MAWKEPKLLKIGIIFIHCLTEIFFAIFKFKIAQKLVNEFVRPVSGESRIFKHLTSFLVAFATILRLEVLWGVLMDHFLF